MGSGTLFKEHRFTVTLPDGTESPCRYDRLGSQYHRFSYAYQDGSALPRQNVFERLANDVKSIEDKGQELASACFRDAIEQERREYFARASEPSDGSRKRCPEKYRMNVKTAKKLGGYYALCHRTQKGLLPFGVAYATLERANAALMETDRLNVVVACCNRLDRCWESPSSIRCERRNCAQKEKRRWAGVKKLARRQTRPALTGKPGSQLCKSARTASSRSGFCLPHGWTW